MIFLRRRIALFVSLLVGLGLFAAARLPLMAAEDQLTVWGAIFAATAALVTAAAVLAAWGRGSVLRSLRLAIPVILLVASSFVYLLIIETPSGRYGLAGLAMLLTAVFFENLRLAAAGPDRAGSAHLINLSFVLDATSLFFLLAFVFGFATFYHVPLPNAAAAVGAVTALIAHEALWRAGFSVREHAVLVVAAGIVGAETYVTLSLLPTSYLVDAAVAVVLLSAALHVVKQVLSGAGELKFFRKELAASLTLAMLLLCTARWF